MCVSDLSESLETKGPVGYLAAAAPRLFLRRVSWLNVGWWVSGGVCFYCTVFKEEQQKRDGSCIRAGNKSYFKTFKRCVMYILQIEMQLLFSLVYNPSENQINEILPQGLCLPNFVPDHVYCSVVPQSKPCLCTVLYVLILILNNPMYIRRLRVLHGSHKRCLIPIWF